MGSSLEKGITIFHPVFCHTDYMRISPANDLLINKKQKAAEKSQLSRKWKGRILEFVFYVKTNIVLQI